MSLLDAILGRVTEVKSAKDGADLKIHVSGGNMPDDVITWKDKYVIVRDQEKAEKPKTPIEAIAEKPEKEHFEGMNPLPRTDEAEQGVLDLREQCDACEGCHMRGFEHERVTDDDDGYFCTAAECVRKPRPIDAEDPPTVCRVDQCESFWRTMSGEVFCRWEKAPDVDILLETEGEGIYLKHALCLEEESRQPSIIEGTGDVAHYEDGELVDPESSMVDDSPPAARDVELTVVESVEDPGQFKNVCRECLDAGTEPSALVQIENKGQCDDCGKKGRRLYMVPLKEDEEAEPSSEEEGDDIPL